MNPKAFAAALALLFLAIVSTFALKAPKTTPDPFQVMLQAQECQELKAEELEPRWVNYVSVPLFMPQGVRRTYLCRGGVFLIREE